MSTGSEHSPSHRSWSSQLSLGQLEAIVAVCDHESVTAAADELGISQPSLSRRIHAMEDALGVALIRPAGRGVSLTDAGRETAIAARRVLAEVSAIGALSASARTLSSGSLRVTGLPSLLTAIAPEIVGPFHRTYPGVDVSVFAGEDVPAVLEALRLGRADIAICATDGIPSDVITVELPPQRFVAVVSETTSSILDSGMLERSTLVTLPVGTSMRAMADEVYRQAGLTAPRVVTTTQRDGLVRLALAVGGITFVPEVMGAAATALGGRCLPLPHLVSRSVGLVYRPDAARNPALRALLDLI